MRSAVACTLGFILFAALGSPMSAQDKKTWQAAVEELHRSEHLGWEARSWSIRKLGEATYPEVDDRTAKLVVEALAQECARGQGGKSDHLVREVVLNACTEALRCLRDPNAVRVMIEAALRGKDPRLPYYTIAALVGSKAGDFHGRLVELADHKDAAVQVAAVDALAAEGKPSSYDLFCRIIGDPARGFEVKVAALQGVKKLLKSGDEKGIEKLLEAMERLPDSQQRVKAEIRDFLVRLLGLPATAADANALRSAIVKKKADQSVPPDGRKPRWSFFDVVPPHSTSRLIFVLDRTGSMADPCSLPPPKDGPVPPPAVPTKGGKPDRDKEKAGEIKKQHDEREVRTKMDALKREYINAIYNLPENVLFSTVWYGTTTTAWSNKLVRATWKNKRSAMAFAEKLQPEGGTNIWAGIEHAFRIIGVSKKPVGQGPPERKDVPTRPVGEHGADTMIVLTDGKHNTGKFVRNAGTRTASCDTQAFLAALRTLNRMRKVILHTICLGDPGEGIDPPDPAFLKKIAEEHGGKFRHVSAKAK
ncbi:MAG: vWA domain-containing protein [Planctomycetota bacterium]|jgi:hypothetical protein